MPMSRDRSTNRSTLAPWLVPLAFAAAWTLPARAADTAHAFVGARLIPIAGPEIADGVLVVRGGASWPWASAATSACRRGRSATTSRAGDPARAGGHPQPHRRPRGADASAPIQPDVRVLDSIDVREPGLPEGAGRRHHHRQRDARLRPPAQRADALPQAARRRHDRRPARSATPTGSSPAASRWPTARTRGARRPSRARAPSRPRWCASSSCKAQEYRDKVKAAAGDAEKLPARDLGMEALVEVLEGKRIVHFHTHRHDDILTVLRLREGVRLPRRAAPRQRGLEGGGRDRGRGRALLDHRDRQPRAESWRRRTCSSGPAPSLEKAGVLRGASTPTTASPTRGCSSAPPALAVRAGMSREKALRGADAEPAREMLDLRRPRRLARGGQGRRLHRALRRSAERVHAGARDLGRGRAGVRSRGPEGPPVRRRRLRRRRAATAPRRAAGGEERGADERGLIVARARWLLLASASRRRRRRRRARRDRVHDGGRADRRTGW